jgi:hypothetical protein
MRTVKFVIDSEPYRAGQSVSLDDQVASNAIASGVAVPNDAHVFGEPGAPVEAVEAPASAAAAPPTKPAPSESKTWTGKAAP